MKRNDMFGRNGKWMRIAGLALAVGTLGTGSAFAEVAKDARKSKSPVKREVEVKKQRTVSVAGPLDPDVAILEQAIPYEPKAPAGGGSTNPQIFFTHQMLKLYLLWLGVDIDTALALGYLEDARLVQMFKADLEAFLRRLAAGAKGSGDDDTPLAVSLDDDTPIATVPSGGGPTADMDPALASDSDSSAGSDDFDSAGKTGPVAGGGKKKQVDDKVDPSRARRAARKARS